MLLSVNIMDHNYDSLPSQAVRGFFCKNMEVCLSWLANIRVYLVSIAIHAGMPAIAIRHGFEALENPKTTVHVRQNKNYTISNLIGFYQICNNIFSTMIKFYLI